MVFGSEHFFQNIKRGMLAGESEAFYTGVLLVVEQDVRPKVSAEVPYPDNEDVIQQILLAVWISLGKFVKTSSDLAPAQRNAWLMRIVNNKIADHYRDKYACREDMVLDTGRERSAAPEYDPAVQAARECSQRMDEHRVDELLLYICSLNVLPEKLLAFLYSKVICFLDSGGSLKGSAKCACEILNGRRFSDIMPAFQKDLDRVLGRQVPREVYDALLRKIGPDSMDCIVEIRQQTVTDSTNYIVKRIRRNERQQLR